MTLEGECQLMSDLADPRCAQFLSLRFGADEELAPGQETENRAKD